MTKKAQESDNEGNMHTDKFYVLMQHCEALDTFVTAARWAIERDDNIDRDMYDGKKWPKTMTDEAFDEVQQAFVDLAEYLKLPAATELLLTIAEEHFTDVHQNKIEALNERVNQLNDRVHDYVAQLGRTRERCTAEIKKVEEELARAGSPFISKTAFDRIASDVLLKLKGIVGRIMDDPNDIPF